MGASVLLAATVAAGAATPDELAGWAWLAVGAVVVATALFRAAPLVGLLVGAATLVGYHLAVGDPLGLAWPLVVVVYGVARAGHLRAGAGFAAVYLATVFAHRAIDGTALDGVAMLHAAAQEGLLLAGALLVGEVVRTRVLQAETAREHLAALERGQEEETQRRIAEERLRIAHDLHDLTAHTVSVVSLHAGVARERFDRDPEQARASLSTIEDASRQAATELRGLVGLLRSEQTPPSDGCDAVHRAVEAARSTGLDVELRLDPPDLPLTGPGGLAVGRIVQESLTNVLRHARARHAEVTIRKADGALGVVVVDDGDGPPDDLTPPQHGVGLAGMRERVEVLGGTLRHGRGAEGGFEVNARLPARGAP
jgi:signal transduction histidine kinase